MLAGEEKHGTKSFLSIDSPLKVAPRNSFTKEACLNLEAIETRIKRSSVELRLHPARSCMKVEKYGKHGGMESHKNMLQTLELTSNEWQEWKGLPLIRSK